MLSSKYEDNALQIKEKSTERTAPFFLCWKLPPVLLPIFWVSIPIRQHCSTVKSARLSAIIWPWLLMRFLRALSNWTKAISADGVKADLESGKTRLAQIQRNRSQIFPAVLERMRISI